MTFEVAWLLRRAVAAETIRRSHHPAIHRTKPSRDQARIRQVGNAQRDIDPSCHQIDHPIVELQVDRDLGIGRQERG